MEQQAMPQELGEWVDFLKPKYLPVQTRTIALLRKLLDNPDSSLRDLQPIIATDPVCSLYVVSLANRLNRNEETDVTSVELAVTTLGMDRIAGIVDQAPPIRLNEQSVAQRCYYRALEDSWFAATVAADICKSQSSAERNEIRLAALVYGAANWALWRYAPKQMSEIRIRIYERGMDSALAEYDVLGCTIQEIGEKLAHIWKLSRLAAMALRHDLSPDHHQLEAIHAYMGNHDAVDDEQKRQIKLLLNSRYYPVKLANWLAQTVPYGWMTEKSRKLVAMIADYLDSDSEQTAARLHRLCAEAARGYHYPGVMAPAAQLLLIPSELVLDYRLEGGSEADVPGATVPAKFARRDAAAEKARAARLPVRTAEPELADEKLFRDVLGRMRQQPPAYREPMQLITDLLRGLKLGVGIERVCLFEASDGELRPCKQAGFDKGAALPRYTQSLRVPTLFRKLADKPLAVWAAPHNRERIWAELPERFKSVCHPQSFALLSLFIGGQARYFLYGDRHSDGLSISEFDFKHFKLLAVAANQALNRLTGINEESDPS